VAWLAMLGVVQLAIPCLLAVMVGRVLSAPEISLLGLLEVLFGVAWVWLGAGEAPTAAVLGGGALVLGRWPPTKPWRCAAAEASARHKPAAGQGHRLGSAPQPTASGPSMARMKQLSGLDATFLHLETPEMPMHVGALHIFELPPMASEGRFVTGCARTWPSGCPSRRCCAGGCG
jgi:hypothetical protein